MLEEGRYLFHGDANPTKLPPVTLLSATTDYGALHPALKRRWIKHFFRPATEAELLGYVTHRSFPVDADAAQLIVSRTKFSGAPWEALEVLRMAVTHAKGRGAAGVVVEDVNRVFELQQMDTLGLRWLDREVIRVLLKQPRYRNRKGVQEFVAYAASENDVCQLANVDRPEFRDSIKSRLMSRQLLVVKPGYGQSLTERAVNLYGQLRCAA